MANRTDLLRFQHPGLPSPRATSRAFTLVELLTVLAVLTLLAGILVPVLARARDRAQRGACLSHLRQLGAAHLLYLQDWDERLSPWSSAAAPRPEPFGAALFWTEYLQPYLHSQAVLHDPSASWPAGVPEDTRLAQYALCTWGPGGFGYPQAPYWRWPGSPLCLDEVVRPGETISLMDGWTTTRGTRVELGRHGGGLNASFLDGHARWLPTQEFWRMEEDERGFYWSYFAADR
jgi:prepilin-type processing-associated H-X9-DG protein/prepilin-type N-terminal cleavage/methylation domain-containing protein